WRRPPLRPPLADQCWRKGGHRSKGSTKRLRIFQRGGRGRLRSSREEYGGRGLCQTIRWTKNRICLAWHTSSREVLFGVNEFLGYAGTSRDVFCLVRRDFVSVNECWENVLMV
ncbi:hypothetical protein AVEN_216585-1, partial [Araneus ventricosus]